MTRYLARLSDALIGWQVALFCQHVIGASGAEGPTAAAVMWLADGASLAVVLNRVARRRRRRLPPIVRRRLPWRR